MSNPSNIEMRVIPGPRPGPLEKRLKARLVVSSTGCHEWTGARHEAGYGWIGVRIERGKHRSRLTHRVAWELAHGPIPAGMFICHRCDNPPCCNPDHLFLGTPAENSSDMARKRRSQAGARHWNARLTPERIAEAQRRHNAGESMRSIGESFGVRHGAISRALSGARWSGSIR